MREAHRWETYECPAIFVSAAPGMDEAAAHWVKIGAEEEGIPCQPIPGASDDALALAYSAAQASRIGVGVGIAPGMVVLQEAHMPPDQPVMSWTYEGRCVVACRLIGGNAGRLVKHLPLRFGEDVFPAMESKPGSIGRALGPADDDRIVAPAHSIGLLDPDTVVRLVAQALSRRGLS